VIQIKGNFDQALKVVRELAARDAITLVNSVNPYRLEGQKTAAFEIVEQLREVPAQLFIPVGNGGNITAYWRGFSEQAHAQGLTRPQMHGAQAQGAAPLVRGKPVARPRTVASAIRIGNPASWFGQSADTTVTVSKNQLKSVSISPANASAKTGDVLHFTAEKSTSRGIAKGVVTWSVEGAGAQLDLTISPIRHRRAPKKHGRSQSSSALR